MDPIIQAIPALASIATTIVAPPVTPPQPPDFSLAPTTTLQEDLTTAGQRHINVIWEYTQAVIAITVTLATMISGAYVTIHSQLQIPTILSVAFGTVVGFYFSRTNHQAIGGVGNQPTQPYVGR